MELFRISHASRAGTLSASGYANRWNRGGQFVLYAASSRSLATLELIVHRASVSLIHQYKMTIISVPDNENYIRQVRISELPENWRTLNAYPKLQAIGGKWFDLHETLILKVPSVIIPQEFNFVINTEHVDFEENVKIVREEDYFFDERLTL